MSTEESVNMPPSKPCSFARRKGKKQEAKLALSGNKRAGSENDCQRIDVATLSRERGKNCPFPKTLDPFSENPRPFSRKPSTLFPKTLDPFSENPRPFSRKPSTLFPETLDPFHERHRPFFRKPSTLFPKTLDPFFENPRPFCRKPSTLFTKDIDLPYAVFRLSTRYKSHKKAGFIVRPLHAPDNSFCGNTLIRCRFIM